MGAEARRGNPMTKKQKITGADYKISILLAGLARSVVDYDEEVERCTVNIHANETRERRELLDGLYMRMISRALTARLLLKKLRLP